MYTRGSLSADMGNEVCRRGCVRWRFKFAGGLDEADAIDKRFLGFAGALGKLRETDGGGESDILGAFNLTERIDQLLS